MVFLFPFTASERATFDAAAAVHAGVVGDKDSPAKVGHRALVVGAELHVERGRVGVVVSCLPGVADGCVAGRIGRCCLGVGSYSVAR